MNARVSLGRRDGRFKNFVPFQVIAAGVFPRTKATPLSDFPFFFFKFSFFIPPYRPLYRYSPSKIFFFRLVASPLLLIFSHHHHHHHRLGGPSSLSSNNLPKPPPFVYCSSSLCLCVCTYTQCRLTARNPVDLFPFLFLFIYLFLLYYVRCTTYSFCVLFHFLVSPVTFSLCARPCVCVCVE